MFIERNPVVSHAHQTHLHEPNKRSCSLFLTVRGWALGFSLNLDLHADSNTIFVSGPTSSVSTGRSGPHADSTSLGVGEFAGCIFLQPWRSGLGKQIVPTLQSVWTNSQTQTLAYYLESKLTQNSPASLYRFCFSQIYTLLLLSGLFTIPSTNLTLINFCSALSAFICKVNPDRRITCCVASVCTHT